MWILGLKELKSRSVLFSEQRCEFEEELSTSGHGRGNVKGKIVQGVCRR